MAKRIVVSSQRKLLKRVLHPRIWNMLQGDQESRERALRLFVGFQGSRYTPDTLASLGYPFVDQICDHDARELGFAARFQNLIYFARLLDIVGMKRVFSLDQVACSSPLGFFARLPGSSFDRETKKKILERLSKERPDESQ